MIPAFLITVREVIEAALIVATIGGILAKLNLRHLYRSLVLGTIFASIVSVLFLLFGSLVGINVHRLWEGPAEAAFEGTLLIISAFFITWAVFWLHTYFSRYKLLWLQKVRTTVSTGGERAIFWLVFTAVLREGVEIVLFLSTIFLSDRPAPIFIGFGAGVMFAITISLLFFSATIRMSVFRTFQVTTLLLVLVAGGLLMRGIAELNEIGVLTELSRITVPLIPQTSSILTYILETFFGWSRVMNSMQLLAYLLYIVAMRSILLRKNHLSLR